jgi:CDP-ribitol ribitolphosphotransferase
MRADPAIVKGLGLGRTDRFYREDYLEECRRAFYGYYPDAKGKKIVLFAPTFRGNASVPEPIDLSFVEDLSGRLGEDWMVLTKLHPHLQKHMGRAACPFPTERLLPVVDVLISDYSSVIYDFLLLERPIVFYAPDLAYYEQAEQFYIDYRREMPGEIVTLAEELPEAVRRAYQAPQLERLRAFQETYMGACDGRALERLVRELELKKAD